MIITISFLLNLGWISLDLVDFIVELTNFNKLINYVIEIDYQLNSTE